MNLRILAATLIFLINLPWCLTSTFGAEHLRSERHIPVDRTSFTGCDNEDLDSLALNQYIVEYMDEHHIPGLSAAIVKDGSVIWTGSFGNAYFDPYLPVTDSTLFMLASITKTITGTALMQLYEQGLFELDDPINDYLPFAVNHPQYPNDDITFFMLLTHTSSIRDNWFVMPYYPGDSPIPLGQYLYNYLVPGGSSYYAFNYGPWEPGTHYEYCNNAVALAGFLVEQISGLPLENYCQQNLFPLVEMTETSYFLANLDTTHVAMPYHWNGNSYDPIGHFGYSDWPSGQLRTSAPQLLRFLTSYLQWGTYGGESVLDSATTALMTSQQIPQIDPSQGLIWYTINFGGRSLWGHGGGDMGVTTEMYMCRDEASGVVILTNGEAYFYDLLDLFFDYAALYDVPLTLELTPHDPPIQIPGIGGSFTFDLDVANQHSDAVTVDLWITAVLPSGSQTEPLLQRNSLLLPAGSTLTRDDLTQLVPAAAPPGDYAYVAHVGQYPALVAASDTIFFSKFIGQSGGIANTGWNLIESTSSAEAEDAQSHLHPTLHVSPNPANPSTTLSFTLPSSGHTRISLYDITGRQVARLVDGWYPAGNHETTFDGERLSSGVYFARYEAGSFMQTRKLLLLK